MNIIIIKDRLKEALSVLSRATSSKESLPILKNILIKVEGDNITLSSTNLEIGINYHLRGKIIEEGEITVPAEVLSKMVNNITHDRLNLSLKENILHITTDDYEAKINTVSSEDFPLIPKIKEKEKFLSLNSDLLKEILEKTTSSAQFSDLRPELNSVLVTFSLNDLIFVSTDSFRLSEFSLSGNQFKTNHKKEFRVLIPLSTANDLVRILPKDQEVKIYHDNTQILFLIEEFSLISRLVEGTFPEYKKIIPDDFNAEITLKREELKNAVKLSSVFSGEANDIIFRKKEDDNHIEIFSHAETKGENISRIPAKIKGSFEEIKFNWKYLNDGIDAIDGEELWVGVIDESKPALFKTPNDNRYFYLLMPILSN